MILFSFLSQRLEKFLAKIHISCSFFISLILVSSISSASFSNNYYLNFTDHLYQNSDFFIYACDEWGFKGAFSPYGLPVTTVELEYNHLPVTDPLYGHIPLSWYGYHEKNISRNGPVVNIEPHWYADKEIHSRFNSYRGDYGFGVFDLFINGRMPGNISWSFCGNKLSYDGQLGIYADQLADNLSQTYQLDFKIPTELWTHVSGMTYQKYTPGIVAAQLEGAVADLQYLNWIQSGDYTEIRINGYYQATRIEGQDSSSIGFNYTNYLYRFHDLGLNNRLDGEATQLLGKLSHSQCLQNLDMLLNLSPVYQVMYFKTAEFQERFLWQPAIGLSLRKPKTVYTGELGTASGRLTGRIGIQKYLRIPLVLSLRLQRDHQLYPYIYFSEIIDNRPSHINQGFTYNLFSSQLQYRSKNLKIEFGLHSVKSNFQIPTQEAISDSSFELNSVALETVYFMNQFSLKTPWQSEIAFNLIAAPQNKVLTPQFQGWGQIAQRISLFNNNLHLYAAAEIFYLYGKEEIIWFEKLRNYGRIRGDFFTNERLQINLRAGARVSKFRIFYVIYNAEGRQFSNLAGMPYRSRLKLFGIEWSFLN